DSLLAQVSRPQGQQSGGVNFGRHIRQHKLDTLKISNTGAKLLAPGGVLDTVFQSRTGNSDCLSRHSDPTPVQRIHNNLETITLLGQHIFGGYADVIIENLHRRGGGNAHLVERLTERQAGRPLLDYKYAHVTVLTGQVRVSNSRSYISFSQPAQSDK